MLEAALNWADEHQLVDDDRAWRLLKPYEGTTDARVRFLNSAGQQRPFSTAEEAGERRNGAGTAPLA
jgi:hypothetical protein